eukprot:891522-Prymnesium_polylepis.1
MSPQPVRVTSEVDRPIRFRSWVCNVQSLTFRDVARPGRPPERVCVAGRATGVEGHLDWTRLY